MQSGLSPRKWALLVMAGLCLLATIVGGLLLASQTNSTGDTTIVAAEVTSAERAEPRPTPIPTETPELVTPPGTELAPEFQGIVQWLNSQPLTMEGQRGKVVLIDFWTYS